MAVSSVAESCSLPRRDSDWPAMGVAWLRLTDFRNYAGLRLTLAGDQGVVLSGPNGAGKSNLLEAVSYLGSGRGLRGAKLDTVDRIPGGGPWAVAGGLETPRGMVTIGSGRVAAENGHSRRTVKIDGVVAGRSSNLAHTVSVIWLTPEMDRLFSGEAGRRRRFLDRLASVLIPEHAGMMAAYERALRERGRLLRDQGMGADPAWLSILEGIMAEKGVAITATRCSVIETLNARCHQEGEMFPVPRLFLESEIAHWLEEGPALEAEDRLRSALVSGRGGDCLQGGASCGPHRSDWMAFERARNLPASQCSTGEQKAMLIGVILASARAVAVSRGVAPLLLLDEIAAHLDPGRRDALLECLPSGGQFWLTGLQSSDFAALRKRAQFLHIEAGKVVPSLCSFSGESVVP